VHGVRQKVRRAGFEPPVVPVLDWMNTGPLSVCEVFSEDNCFTADLKVYLTLNRLADTEQDRVQLLH
jgi:hypothetical protein